MGNVCAAKAGICRCCAEPASKSSIQAQLSNAVVFNLFSPANGLQAMSKGDTKGKEKSLQYHQN